ncbi:MAG: gliding motility-associated C-terminal domain-containing protein [Bacteroidales bacterium]|nr:gliding motility-associated C-terminal domain-containing protein [Bacteroidales bacterium]
MQADVSGGKSPYTYDWSGPGGYTETTTSSPATIPNAHHPTNSGNYKVEVTDANGCKADATASITVSAPVDPGEISVDITSVCKGETKAITLSSTKAPTGGHNPSYQWRMQEEGGAWVDISGATDFNGWTGDITFDKTTKFRRVFFNACGNTESNEVTVTIVEPAVLDPGGPYTVCPGQTVTLQGKIVSGATQGVWSGGAGTWNAPTTLNGATYTPAASEYGTTVQLTLSTTDAGGACGQQSVTVDLVVAPEIKLTFDKTEVCVNDAPFIPSVAANVSGSGSLVTVDFDVNLPFDPAAYVGAGPKKFKYQYTAGGCTAEEEFTITVTNPQVFAITNTSPATYCASGLGVTINLNGSESGLTYTVYKDGVATTHETTGTGGTISISGVKDGGGIYTIRATDANGCWIDMNGMVTLTEVSDVGSNTIAADQTICSGSSATPLTGPEPTGGNGTYIYQWQSSPDGTNWTDISGANSQNYDPGKVSAKTYYRRYVTSGACDNTSAPVTISVTTPIQNNTIGADQTICYGAVPSKLTGQEATSSGGTVSYIWEVSTDGTTFTPAGGTERDFNPGIPLYADTWYRRVATDGGACPDDDENLVKITVREELKVSVTASTEPSCGNGTDGSLTATVTGGKGSFQVAWKNNDDGTSFLGNPFTAATKGNYTVTVHDEGCAQNATNTFTLTAPADVTGTATPKHITSCFGNAEGEITVTGAGGTAPYTFTLSGQPDQTGASATFTGLAAGAYTINIKDVNGCEGAATATINQPDQLQMGTHDLVNPSCVGNADGQITVNATGGTGALTYTINGGSSAPVGTATTGLGADTYTIVVTDANGCTETGSAVLNNPAPVTLTATGIDVTGCPGSPTGGIALTPAGGTAPYEYQLDGGTWEALGSSINNLAAGTYTVKVRDANLCESAEQTVTVAQPNALSFTASGNALKCAGDTDGVIEIKDVTGGTAPYQVSLDGNGHDGTVFYAYPAERSQFDNLPPGTYTVTLKDAADCELPQSVTIDAPAPIALTLDEVGKIECPTPPASFIKFTATGGQGTLRYTITGAMSKSGEVKAVPMIVQDLFQGSYSLTITDENGCMQGPIAFDIEQGNNLLQWNGVPQPTDVTCHGLDDGGVEIYIKGGIGPFSYILLPQSVGAIKYEHLSEPSRTYMFTGVKPGVYNVMVVDEGNAQYCPIQRGERVEVKEPKPITIDPIGSGSSWTNISCHDTNDGEITIAAKGGTGELIVTLYKNSVVHSTLTGSPVTFSGLDEGDYYVEITDPNGCTPAVSSTYTMVNPSEVVATLAGSTNIDCAGNANGTISIVGVAGGSGVGYEYSIDGGASYVSIADPTSVLIDGLSAGDYTVQVRDGNGCEAVPINVTITQPEPLVLSVAFTNPSCSTVGELAATATGGTAPYEFSFDAGTTWGAGTLPGVSSGSYSIWLRDANGCEVQKDTVVETPTDITIISDLQVLNQPSCEELGRLHIEAEGGTQPLNYKLFLDGVATPVIEQDNGDFAVKDAGDYYVVVEDANGCFGKTSVKVTIDAAPYVTITSLTPVDVLCGGKATGEVTAIATGGATGDIIYTLHNDTLGFSESNTTGVFADLHASNYYYMVASDGASCADTLAFAITAPDTLKIEVDRIKQETTLGMTDGELDVVAHGGVAPYTYTLRSGSTVVGTNTDGKFKSLLSATYWAIVEDVNGCKDSVRVVLQSVNAYTIDHAVSCYGGSDGWFDLIIHGTPPYTIYGYRLGLSPLAWHFTETDMIQIDDTTYRLTNLVADKYFFMIGDQFSGINFQATIYEPDPLVVSMGTVVQPICATGGYGSVEFDVSGSVTYDELSVVLFTPTYVIAWERADGLRDTLRTTTTGIVTVPNLDPGEYKFTVTTERGCSPYEFDITLTGPEAIEVAVNVLQESSYDAGNGLIEANATGGVPDLVYVLHTVGGASSAPSPIGLFSNVARGKYVVEAIDANGCTGLSDTIEIRGTDVVIDAITPATCFGSNDGSFQFHIEHGFPPFAVSVTDAGGSAVTVELEAGTYRAESLLAGDYTIAITDSLGNTLPPYVVTIGQPDKLMLSITNEETPACSGDAAGSVDFAVVGGTPGYSIIWSVDGQPADTLVGTHLDGINGGSYYFVVLDAAGCSSDTLWHTIAQPSAITLASSVVESPTCYGEPTGRIEVVAEGGSDFLYQLDALPATANGVFENLLAGTHTVTVQDVASGCQQTFSFDLVEAPAISITIDDSFTGIMNCPYDTDGYISLSVSGGHGDYRYIWPQLGESSSSVSGLAPDDYVVIVADNMNCTASETITISGPAPFEFFPSVVKQADCRYSVNSLGGELHVSGTGGTAPYTYSLIDPSYHSVMAGAPNFTGLGAGVYEVVATDANGCRYTKLDTVPINPRYDFEVGTMDTTVCFANEVTLEARLDHGALFDTDLNLNYEWWAEANAGNAAPDATGQTFHVEDLEVNTYRYRLRVSMSAEPKCYVEKWFDVGVYPKLDLHVPLYVSSVQNDTILSILFNQEYNVDVSANNFDYATSFEWKPQGVFTVENSWNSSIFMTPEKYEELRATYPNRFVRMRDPQTKREGEFFKADVVATTDVGCKDSLTLYTKIVSKLYLANVFSPNGDGRNDIWRIPKEYLFPDLEIEIFNRWGALVWSAQGDRAARGWDGRTNNGKHLPIGTYWYVIKFNINSDDWKPLTGSVTIVK